jgi:hypothetical protein
MASTTTTVAITPPTTIAATAREAIAWLGVGVATVPAPITAAALSAISIVPHRILHLFASLEFY